MKKPICIAVAATVGISGCANLPGDPAGNTAGASNTGGIGGFIQTTFNNPDPCSDNARNIGGVAGVAVGATVGAVVAKNKLLGSLIGAATGALLGGLIGHEIDARRCALSKIAKAHNLDMTMTPVAVANGDGQRAEEVGLSVSVKDMPHDTEFRSGSDALTPDAVRYFSEIAAQYRPQTRLASAKTDDEKAAIANTRILLIGHTDDTGDSQRNADLSERRARAVAKVFVANGVPADSVFYQGAGETLPVADNRTEQGRASNRRVEIVDMSDAKSDILANYISSRTPNYQYYRPADAATRLAQAAPSRESHRPARRPPKGKAKAPIVTADENAGASAPPSAAGEPAAAVADANSNASTAEAKRSTPPAGTTVAGSPNAGASAAGQATPFIAKASVVDFGWQATQPAALGVNFGSVSAQKSLTSFIGSAQADEVPVSRSCANDRVRVANSVKSVRNDADVRLNTSAYYPGLYNTSWVQTVNGHLVALTGVAVLRDGAVPVHNPELLVYRDYTPAQGKDAKPAFRLRPQVNAYPVSQGVLYRVFVDNGNLFSCMDVVFPKAAPFVASQGQLVRTQEGKFYSADFRPTIVK